MKIQRVVVGYDGSEHARSAIEAATNLVADGGTVHVVVAYHAPSPTETAEMLESLPDEFKASYDPLANYQGRLDEAEHLIGATGVDHVGHLVSGRPAAAILDIADEVDADLIVVGSRGLGRASRFVRGSVSSRVASHAKRSFLVIHDEELDQDDG